MAQPFSEDLKQQWRENILKQRQSKLSITAWCRQNGIVVHTFYYWQGKLLPKPILSRADFAEATEGQNKSTTITLVYQGFTIHLSEDFNSSVLKRCLEVLKTC